MIKISENFQLKKCLRCHFSISAVFVTLKTRYPRISPNRKKEHSIFLLLFLCMRMIKKLESELPPSLEYS